ncbi:MAG TPA: 4'-phosphopantetheinyl transferase superfamily protein [Thermoanaerobaculia bacterium]|nr:4'-phosphopantetheinyl transferase superfamily protein [Thermoanaerobaculia bacterium]
MKRVPLPEPWRRRAIVIADAPVSDEWFTADELAVAESFRLAKRTAEWKLSRVAAKQMAIELRLCTSPRDCIVDRPWLHAPGARRYVSISHSGGFAAAAIDAEPVGIDVERVRDLKESAAHLFLTGDETDVMRGSGIANRMLHFWAAKEAAWKRLGGATETLKRVPLKLEAETATGLRFDHVETFATGEIVIALTRPTSSAGSSRR